MICCNPIEEIWNYGGSAQYCCLPSPEQQRAGVVPLDSLPAAWWNKMWADATSRINEARCAAGVLIDEVCNVLVNAGVCPSDACLDQLYQSINKIRQTLGTASVAGAVKSSSNPSEVAIDANGFMSVNCLGNASSLTTSASTVVGAINELKSTYDCCFTDTATALGGKAPTSHADSATTYGVGNADCYGHLKVSDTYDSVLADCSGVAASQCALATAYGCLCGMISGIATLGNTAGCALGTAAAGTCTTAARSDHVHPKQTCVACAGADGSGCTFGTAARYACTCFRAATWTPSCVACAGCATCSSRQKVYACAVCVTRASGAGCLVTWKNLCSFAVMTFGVSHASGGFYIAANSSVTCGTGSNSGAINTCACAFRLY